MPIFGQTEGTVDNNERLKRLATLMSMVKGKSGGRLKIPDHPNPMQPVQVPDASSMVANLSASENRDAATKKINKTLEMMDEQEKVAGMTRAGEDYLLKNPEATYDDFVKYHKEKFPDADLSRLPNIFMQGKERIDRLNDALAPPAGPTSKDQEDSLRLGATRAFLEGNATPEQKMFLGYDDETPGKGRETKLNPFQKERLKGLFQKKKQLEDMFMGSGKDDYGQPIDKEAIGRQLAEVNAQLKQMEVQFTGGEVGAPGIATPPGDRPPLSAFDSSKVRPPAAGAGGDFARKFDPESGDYDYESYDAFSMPVPEGQIVPGDVMPNSGGKRKHYPSRVELPEEVIKESGLPPGSGLLLKGKQHETWDLLVEGEKEAGYEIFKHTDGRYYSKPKDSKKSKKKNEEKLEKDVRAKLEEWVAKKSPKDGQYAIEKSLRRLLADILANTKRAGKKPFYLEKTGSGRLFD